MRDLAGSAGNVVTIPNGVDEAFLGGMLPAGQRRGVEFWGNLDFGVQVRIIGAHAPDWLVRMAAVDDQIELLGFVPDLRAAALTGFPVAVNAMRTGSGLKNKVAEAFAQGLAVVTTTRGVEALAPVRDGTHVRVEDDAAGFARAVLDLLSDVEEPERMRSAVHAVLEKAYTWPVIAASWRALFVEDTAGPDLGAVSA